MSDAPRNEAGSFDSVDSDEPTMDELDRVAYDAVVRNAPRFGRFIGTGVGIGALVGLVIGLVLPNSTAVGRGTVAILVMAGFAMIGALVSSALAAGIDGTRKSDAQAGFPWEEKASPYEPDADSVGQEEAK